MVALAIVAVIFHLSLDAATRVRTLPSCSSHSPTPLSLPLLVLSASSFTPSDRSPGLLRPPDQSHQGESTSDGHHLWRLPDILREQESPNTTEALAALATVTRVEINFEMMLA